MAATATRTRCFAPVTVEAILLRRPIAACTLLPDGAPGEVEVKDAKRTVRYSLAYLVRKDAEGRVDIDGYRIVKGTGEFHDVPESLDSCTCGDGTFRVRPGGCRHQQALRQLRDQGQIA